MALTGAYVQGYGKIPELFSKIRDGQAPSQFSQQLLKDLGFSSSNDRRFIPLLKALGFLSADGKPTSIYHSYRDHSQSKLVMAKAIREAYQDIFLIKENPTEDDKDTIQGKFKSYHNTTDRVAQLMTNTFLSLLTLSDLNENSNSVITKKPLSNSKTMEDIKKEPQKDSPNHHTKPPSLNYNIQIHLPATKDIEVYNAIFRSLKEHLYEV